MTNVYGVLVTLHNAFAGLTLLLTLVAAVLLLVTSRTTSRASSLVLRADLISASLQFVFGLLLVVVGLVVIGAASVLAFWYHYLLGIIAVGVISALVARGRRAPDTEARRYGLLFLAALLLVGVTFYIGQTGGFSLS